MHNAWDCQGIMHGDVKTQHGNHGSCISSVRCYPYYMLIDYILYREHANTITNTIILSLDFGLQYQELIKYCKWHMLLCSNSSVSVNQVDGTN